MRHRTNMASAAPRLALALATALTLAGAACSALAQDAGANADANANAGGWIAADAHLLDSMRGGFINAAGLRVSLGLERLVSINGSVVARTSFQVTDLGNMSAEQARQTGAALSSIKLVQNGSDNIYHAAVPAQALGGTVIQNSLNDQLIQSRTVISSSVNSAALLNTLHFQATLGDALARAALPR